MSKLLKNFVGIDISKLFFDVAIIKADQCDQITHHQFKQSPDGFTHMNEWLTKHGVVMDEQTLFCMEYTGIYNSALVNYLYCKTALLWVEMAVRIKKSEGFERACNDKSDAAKIAKYAFRYQDKKRLWSPVDENLNRIKHLITQRDRMVESITRLTVPVNELRGGWLPEAVH